MKTPRFYLTMAAYAILAALAGVTLDGPFRLAVWALLAGLAIKTVLVVLRQDHE